VKPTGCLRTDIGNKYPQYNNNNSGFHYSLDTSKLSNGSHEISIRETSLTGVKTTLPNITVNVTNKPSAANIKYYLSESSYVTVKIYDSTDNLVRTIDDKARKTAGWNYAKWDGRNSQGTIVPDGKYTYKITAYDDVGLSTTKSGTIIIERLAPYISSVSDSPDPLIPGETDDSTIEFTLSEDANVVVKVFNSIGALQKTLINKALKMGTNKVTWDGATDSGNRVNNGKYSYTIDASDSFDKKAHQATGSITVGYTSLVISDNSVTPDPFTPTGSNVATVSYNLSANGKVTVTILDSSNNTVKVLENDSQKSQGRNSVTWAGK
jgi:flagellar hook assembly protein FlgD